MNEPTENTQAEEPSEEERKRPRLLGGGIIEIDGMKFPPEFFEDIKTNRAGLWRFVNKGSEVRAEFIRDSEEAMNNFNNMVTLCAGMLSAAGGMISIPDGFVMPSSGIETTRDEEGKATVVSFAK